MNAQKIMDSEDFKRCVKFHGHICPGLSIGYRAVKLAMNKLEQAYANDEETVAIVESDACSADAVQVLSGCTFGKGNLIFKDHGKMVFTMLSRKNGHGVRVAMRSGAFSTDGIYLELLRKKINGDADEKDKKQFGKMHFQKSCEVLEMPDDKLFAVKTIHMQLPPKARIEQSEPCDECKEPTMVTKLETVNGKKLCRTCLKQCRIKQDDK